jgi:D-lactate dehydrogenase (cytochrome)
MPPCRDADDEVASYLSDAASFPGGHATRVCFPASEGEVAAVLRREPQVLCVGAQSSLTGGATPRGGCVLSTARLASLHCTGTTHATAGSGLVLRTLAEELARRGLHYPPVPTWDGATIGGTVATNAAGAATFKHGSTRDWVTRAVFVLAGGDVLELHRGEVTADDAGGFTLLRQDGSRVRVQRPDIVMPDVAKISCGYVSRPGMDLLDLLIGSEGTLAVATEVEIRVAPQPNLLVALVPLGSEAHALDLTDALRTESLRTRRERDPFGLDVAAIEYIDAASLRLLREDHVFEKVHLTIAGEAGALLLLQVELPEMTEEALGCLGRILDGAGALAATITAPVGDETRRAALFAVREAVPEGVNRRIRETQRELGAAISKAAADVVVPADRLGEAMRAYRAIAARHDLECLIWGHVSDGNVHPNLLPHSVDDAARAQAALLEIGRTAIALGGAPMAEHGVGRNPVKQQLLLELYGRAGVESMRAVKRAFDPRGVLAPGVLFGDAPDDVRP